ncbi:MAG: LysR family transcriptional regulator, partial [Pseudomonadota bacterium]
MKRSADLIDMEIFARVVKTGSMSAAAREMNFSPAVISKRIQRLEQSLNTRLLQRTTRQIALTEAGQGYYERVLAILARVEEAEGFVAQRNAEAHGTLRISAPTSFARLHIAPHIARFLKENPGLRLELALSDAFVDVVGDGFDLAIRIGELSDSSLVARRLCANRRVLCASPDYLGRRGVPRDIHDLQHHQCLTTTSQDVWRLEGSDGPVNARVESFLPTNSSEVIREAVITGLGIALRSTWDVADELRDGRLQLVLPQYDASCRVAIHAIYPSRRFLAAKVRTFIDFFAARNRGGG